MIVFVTVGTTEFDELTYKLSSNDCLEILKAKGYTEVVMQIGNGTVPPIDDPSSIPVKFYHFKPSTKDDIKESSLVISHAGSGSILDALGQYKPLIAVVNPSLMDNHQAELAKHLDKLGHLKYSEIGNLLDTIQKFDGQILKPFPPGEPQLLSQYLDHKLGYK